MIPRLARLPLIALLYLQAGFIELRADSEWRPWFEKIHSRLADTLTAPQRSALGKPPVRLTDGKNPGVESADRQVVVSDAALELWGRLALAIGRDAACPGYFAEFLRRCADATNGMAALPDPAEIETKK